MVAMLAFGGTFAYFTATAEKKTTGEFTTGSIKLESNDDATFVASLKNVVPGDALTTGALTLTPTSAGTDSYIAIRVTITATDSSDTPLDLSGTSLASAAGLLAGTPVAGSTWVPASGTYPNVFVLAVTTPTTAPTAVTTGTPINITDDALTFTADDNWDQSKAEEGYISDSKLMGATLSITIEARSVQSKNWNDGGEADADGATATVDGIAAELFPTPVSG